MQKLIEKIKASQEVVVYPVGARGKIFLDYCQYNGLLKNISCLAAGDTVSPNTYDHFLPKIHFKNLVHFKDTALFIVAAFDQKEEDKAKKNLADMGCKNIIIFDSKKRDEANKFIKLYLQGNDILLQKFEDLARELKEIKLLVSEQNELCDTNKKAFEEYRNAFRGKKIVIVGGGPTLNYYKPFSDAIHIGLNFAWRNENIPLDFLFTNDRVGNKETKAVRMEQGFDKIKEKIFVTKRVDRSIAVKTDHSEDFAFKSDKIVRFYSKVVSLYSSQIYQDICYHPVMGAGSVVFSALQFALFTCPKEIYLTGCDVTTTGHFYAPDKEFKMTLPRMKVAYARMKTLADHHYPETKIISINPVGLKGLFEDIYTDTYKVTLK